MAKKAVASLQTGSKKLVKAIRVVKKDEGKGYCFDEKILPQDLVNDWLAGKPIEVIQAKQVKEEPKLKSLQKRIQKLRSQQKRSQKLRSQQRGAKS